MFAFRLAYCCLALSCGGRVIDRGVDGGAQVTGGPGAGTSAGGGTSAGSVTSGGAGSTVGTGGQAGSTGTETCRALGESCASGNDCCSAFCERNACVAACSDDGSPCMAPSQCCSGRCNAGVCGNLTFSLLDGDRCFTPASCKSYSCERGYCGLASCGRQDDKCGADTDCCGRTCTNSICDGPPSCRLSGSSCRGSDECCNRICSPMGRCDSGGSIGDSACTSPFGCVTGFCTGGHCNRVPRSCPSGPGSCENCLALNCCDIVSVCTTSDDCPAAFACFRRCTRAGGTRASCDLACGVAATGIGPKLLDCGAHRCSASCN